MHYSKHKDVYIIRLMPGEELMETLKAFCQEQNIKGGVISGIGGVREVEIAYLQPVEKEYVPKKFSGGLEVSSLNGNVAGDKLHIHMTVADSEYKAYAGHCNMAVADPTLEVILKPTDELQREIDDYSGLPLLKLDN